MAIDIPDKSTVVDRIIADYEAELSQNIPDLEKAVFKIQAQSYGGSVWTGYKLAQAVSLDILPNTARAELLTAFGVILNLPRQAAVSTELQATATGTNGETILAGVTYKGPNQIVYVNLTNQTIAAGTATLNLRALEGGVIGNLITGDELNIVTPQALIDNIATVTVIITEGVNEESDDAYRQRLVDRFRLRPQGGAKIDYIIWAQTVSGVTRVFPFTQSGGTVDIYFLRDNDTPRHPDLNERNAVYNAIDQPDRRPAAAIVVIKSLTDIIFNVEITGFTGSGADEITVEDNIEKYLLARQPYVSGVDIDTSKSIILLVDITVIVSLIASFTGVELFNNAAPATPIITYTLGDDEVADKGTVSFI